MFSVSPRGVMLSIVGCASMSGIAEVLLLLVKMKLILLKVNVAVEIKGGAL